MDLKSKIRVINDFPKKGISFKDITTLLKDAEAFKEAVDLMYEHIKDKKADYIIGPEARGFMFAAALSYKAGTGFIPVRKKGKLPSKAIVYNYEKEYGFDSVEIHEDAIKKGDRVVIVDDLLATGGTIEAVCMLLEKAGAKIVSIEFLIELTDLRGREHIKNYDVNSLIKYNV